MHSSLFLIRALAMNSAIYFILPWEPRSRTSSLQQLRTSTSRSSSGEFLALVWGTSLLLLTTHLAISELAGSPFKVSLEPTNVSHSYTPPDLGEPAVTFGTGTR